ncbi:major facilitator superfamily domain-containing protein [Podospora didyma]|uniref:Major facilitator superfamily domain-containing protein n=1 Tax=Podospora didyma TaxID=330526 RepID=A0AAE0N0L6_9PEZI|nr:major facilitator superfamily domain-containing protein [Podospora didyma]
MEDRSPPRSINWTSSLGDLGSTSSSESRCLLLNPDSFSQFQTTGEDATISQREEELNFIDACKLYPAAIAWSTFVSLGVVIVGFHSQILGNIHSMPRFQRDFGHSSEHSSTIPQAWQTGLSMGSRVAQTVGALIVSYPMDQFGRKRTFGAYVVSFSAIVCVQFFARSLEVLLVGELLSGLILGCFTDFALAYSSDVCPTALRGVVTGSIKFCFVIGQLFGNGVTMELIDRWAYSTPFAAQSICCLIII